jgi:hypothetical protein
MNLLRPSLFVLVTLAACAAAGATTVKTAKPAASQPAARTWATREQLRDCLDTEAALKERFKAVEAATEAHEQLFNQVEAESDKLRALQDQVDHDSEVSVRAFNELVKEHNLHVKQLNQDAADTRPATDAYNADMTAYNHRCAPLVYRVEDMDAVLRERKKAAAALAAASAASR